MGERRDDRVSSVLNHTSRNEIRTRSVKADTDRVRRQIGDQRKNLRLSTEVSWRKRQERTGQKQVKEGKGEEWMN